MNDAATGTTEDGFLDGRLRLTQPRRGHRAGHDAILLAAATPAFAGECIVDLGAGVGAAGLAVAARVSGTSIVLVERDESLVALARTNITANGLSARVVALDVTAPAQTFADAGLPPDCADRVLMNPPFNSVRHHQPSPDPQRRGAHEADDAVLERWSHAARRLLKPRGTLTLIWRADGLADLLQALGRGFGGITLLPVHPASDAPALRVLVRATKGSAAPTVLLPGLMLHDESGRTPIDVEAVLGGRKVLPLATL